MRSLTAISNNIYKKPSASPSATASMAVSTHANAPATNGIESCRTQPIASNFLRDLGRWLHFNREQRLALIKFSASMSATPDAPVTKTCARTTWLPLRIRRSSSSLSDASRRPSIRSTKVCKTCQGLMRLKMTKKLLFWMLVTKVQRTPTTSAQQESSSNVLNRSVCGVSLPWKKSLQVPFWWSTWARSCLKSKETCVAPTTTPMVSLIYSIWMIWTTVKNVS